MNTIKAYISTSLGKKQVVAASGLLLMLFVVFHLSANLLAFAGPEMYNFFPEKMHENPKFLLAAEFGLTVLFLTHIFFTVLVVKENRKARQERYDAFNPEARSLPTRLMPVTGAILLAYLITHINDYVFAEHTGAGTLVNGAEQGLYGLVYNSFTSPVRVVWYVIAMMAIGLHLAHAFQSVFQTFGWVRKQHLPTLQKISTGVGLVIGLAFSSIPLYFVFIATTGKG